jgi:hypothetical protein
MLKEIFMSFLSLLKIDVAFKIIIRCVIDHYWILIQW